MSEIRLLLGQTFWYGLSSLFARFLNYLLTPYLTSVLLQADYGEMSIVYAAIPFFMVVFMQGLETAYFRFSRSKTDEERVYNTTSIWLIISTLLLFLVLIGFKNGIASLMKIKEHPEYVTMSACIIVLDTLCSLSFTRLRFHSRPRKFAFIKITSILVNIVLVIFFISVCPWLKKNHPGNFLLLFYDEKIGLGYIFIANIFQSAFCLLLLWKEFFSFKLQFDVELWKKIMLYSLPLIVIGICNAINETADRIMLGWWSQSANIDSVKEEVATYSACSKLSALIAITIYAFRLGAEPFFFKAANNSGSRDVYGRVMNFFVIALCAMFLAVSFNLDIFKHFIQNPNMWPGLKAVPVMLMANIFLGINYNLSIWFKLKNRTSAGALINIAGACITIAVNYFFIPAYGYMACAWASVCCYGSMVIISYLWGQVEYPIKYPVLKVSFYISLSIILYFIYNILNKIYLNSVFSFIVSAALFILFCLIVYKIENKEFKKIAFFRKIKI
ncbi:MAG: oligosaccharide flippase family protein [Ferruginibacter sp.]